MEGHNCLNNKAATTISTNVKQKNKKKCLDLKIIIKKK